MLRHFTNLNDDEQSLLLNAPALITVLVAGADGKIDEKEKEWGAKVAHFRGEKKESILHDYYCEVEKTFDDSLNDYISSFPQDLNARAKEASQRLEKLNDIFPKLDKEFADELYHSFVSFAQQIAKASGGILGYSAISTEEQEMARLPMIKDPVNHSQ